jgi:hypothetical protein
MTEERRVETDATAGQPAVSQDTALQEQEIAIKAREVSLTARFQALSFVSAVLCACLAFFGTAYGNWQQANANRKLEREKSKENQKLEQRKLSNDLAIERQKLEGNLILTFLADKNATARKENLLFLNRAGYIHLPTALVKDIETGDQPVPRVDPMVDFGPPEGSAQLGTPLADLNRLWNRSEPPKPDDFDASVDLRRMLAATDDKALEQTKAATIEGYVLQVKSSSPTSANMKSVDFAKRNIDIMVAQSMQSGPNEEVICVVTPRFRVKHRDDWSQRALAALKGKKCKITGWLSFNFEHVRQSANNPTHGKVVWRGTPWELHPVTAIEPSD